MPDEFVCEECAYSTALDEKDCPLCGGKIVSLEEGYADDTAYAEAYSDDTEEDAEMDFGEEMPRTI
jgi:hypothetical protein